MINHDLTEISDGKLYSVNDLVKVGCHDCEGCSDCCCDMGQSVILDPYDVYALTRNLGQTMQELLEGPLELHVDDGLILPNLKMEDHCSFLNEAGRCSIHGFRPGLCRLFPLGRNYDETGLKYFLLIHECPVKNKSKLKVSKWLGVGQIRDYQAFLVEWHDLTKEMKMLLTERAEDENYTKQLNMLFLQIFYLKPYHSDDFYEEFRTRMEQMRSVLR